MSKFLDRTGKRYGRLIALKRIENNKQGAVMWECQCDCGNKTIVRGSRLGYGTTRSCGCLSQEYWNFRKLPRGIAVMRSLLGVYKRGAERRNLSWELTEEEFKELTSSNCHYCGINPQQEMFKEKDIQKYRYNGSYLYNGIDRKDNEEGYILDNVVPCCGICNLAKGKQGYKEFLEHILRVTKYLKLEE